MCNCADEMDAKLKDHGGKLVRAIALRGNTLIARLLVSTEKTDPKKRKPLPVVAASFCPFCGVRFAD